MKIFQNTVSKATDHSMLIEKAFLLTINPTPPPIA